MEQLKTGDLSFGTYSLPAGTKDAQSPHTEDEIYFIVSGQATFWTPGRSVPVVPGSAVFVPAHEPHRFTDITEDLTAVLPRSTLAVLDGQGHEATESAPELLASRLAGFFVTD